MKEAPVTWQVCLVCATEWQELSSATRCAACGGLLEVRHRLPELRGTALRAELDARVGGSGVWRFRELVLPAANAPISYPEGNTPLISSAAVASWAGVAELTLKHEGLNPTGSFKDRGMTVGITQAQRLGVRAVVCASTGNTSASLATYGALAGIPVCVLVPGGKSDLGKLAQTVGAGARVLAVQGDFDACLRLVEESGERLGWYLLNSINPFRIEGQKTIVFELLQQLGWQVPDWIVLPGGNLGNTAAIGKGLGEALQLGLIERLPRLAVIQAEGAAPFAQSFAEGFRHRYEVQAETVASAIRIGSPVSWERAVAAIRATQGVVTAVSDAEILEAKRVVDRAGVGCEPASAASVAGVRRLVSEGTIGAGARVSAILTGHLLKDPEALLGDRTAVQEIAPSLQALRAAVDAAGGAILR